MKKRILSMLMACMMVVSTFIISRPLVDIHAAETDSGISFTASEFYQATDVLTALPQTFEATIKLPSTQTARAGVILSTYQGTDNTALAIEIYSDGNPRFFLQKSSWADDIDVKFTDVNVATGEWVHLVITRDIANKTLKCYVDGVLKQTVTYTEDYVETNKIPYYIGGDARGSNSQYFKGQIKDVAVYSDLRTASEIASDVNGIGYTDANLLLAYDFSVSGSERLRDYSMNENHLVYTKDAISETYAPDDSYLTFSASNKYQTEAPLSAPPLTIEATVYFPSSASGKRGVIVGNYAGSPKCVSVEVTATGAIRLYNIGANGTLDKTFTDINVFRDNLDTWTHIAVVRDTEAGEAYCYINGELKGTVTLDKPIEVAQVNPLGIGGDLRTGNTAYFQGYVKNVAAYADVRSADEIVADIKDIDENDADLLVSYDFTVEDNDRLKDHSNNKNHLVNTNGTDTEVYIGDTGKSFIKNNLFQTEGPLSGVPLTIEALVCVPTTVGANRVGVIYGNYKTNGVSCVSMEVLANGVPRFYWIDDNGSAHDCVFSSVRIIGNNWTHVTFVRDIANGKAHCYINGVLEQTVNISSSVVESKYTTPICIGGDLRSGNSCAFLGKILNITAYSDVRTADEIAADYSADAPDYDDTALIAHYDLSKVNSESNREAIVDTTGNGNTVYTPWMVKNDGIKDYSYTFAVVGDTQKVSDYDLDNGTQLFAKIYDYIVNSIDEQNVKLVIGLGDITENWGSYDSEWELAQKNIFKLNGKVPYILNRGNHDPSNKFNAYFNNTAYSEQLEGTYNGNIDNSYFTLTVGEIKYLVMALDYGPSDAVLSWAAGVVDSHKEYNVIITTHAYMYRDGTTLDQGDVCPPATTGGSNNGDDVWEKFVKNHENIVLVLSGHDPWDKIVMREDDGVNGNKVVQMLIDPQGMDANSPVGMVAMFHFSEDGKTVQVEYYSTIEEKWYHPDNQFTFTLDVVEPCDHEGLWKDGVCSSCGEACPGHEGGEATCQKGAICDICGYEYTEKNSENHGTVSYVANGDKTHKVVCEFGCVIDEDAACELDENNVCKDCEHDYTVKIAEDNFNEVFDSIYNGGQTEHKAEGPAEGALNNSCAIQGEKVSGFTYGGFNLEMTETVVNTVKLRHHVLLADGLTVKVNGEEVTLTKVNGNYYYFEVEVEIGKFSEAHTITVDETTVVTASVHSYMKTAFEADAKNPTALTDAQENLLKALYDWDYAVANAN